MIELICAEMFPPERYLANGQRCLVRTEDETDEVLAWNAEGEFWYRPDFRDPESELRDSELVACFYLPLELDRSNNKSFLVVVRAAIQLAEKRCGFAQLAKGETLEIF